MAAEDITARYTVLFAATFIATIIIFNAAPSQGVEALTAQTTSATLNLLGLASKWVQTDATTTLTLTGQNTITVTIVRECTALNVLGVIAGLIIPLKAKWTQRLAGVTLAAALLFALNIPRIALTLYLTAYPTYPLTLLAEATLETYHYPISFAFGVIGVAVTILAVDRWTTPTLSKTLLAIFDKATNTKGSTPPN